MHCKLHSLNTVYMKPVLRDIVYPGYWATRIELYWEPACPLFPVGVVYTDITPTPVAALEHIK